ncbi:unnamed protein product [Effrenium voratum]|uniref:Autophagy-related protein n=1 Tax=Effrenium voratum TaxID=2562239 RepID=A0AA36NK50_9DINO|nr:unnamed protein product [Effrenium voratum]CAJ1416969.1 unnamed protein product [Effrenium voratum]
MAPKVRKHADKEASVAASEDVEERPEVEDTSQEKNTTFLQRTPSATNQAVSDLANDRRLMGAAATLGGAAGTLLMGPVSGVALGAAALYATTREDSTGSVARKAGTAYLTVADSAIDEGIRAVDRGVKAFGCAVDRGCRHLETSASVPTPIRVGLQNWRRQACEEKAPRAEADDEAHKIRSKYPDRIPVICDKSARSTLPELPKKKFVVHGTMLCGEFKYMVHKQIADTTPEQLSVDQTIYLFINGITPKTSTPMSQLYDQFRASDGFLYIRYGAENTLGSDPCLGFGSGLSRFGSDWFLQDSRLSKDPRHIYPTFGYVWRGI